MAISWTHSKWFLPRGSWDVGGATFGSRGQAAVWQRHPSLRTNSDPLKMGPATPNLGQCLRPPCGRVHARARMESCRTGMSTERDARTIALDAVHQGRRKASPTKPTSLGRGRRLAQRERRTTKKERNQKAQHCHIGHHICRCVTDPFGRNKPSGPEDNPPAE